MAWYNRNGPLSEEYIIAEVRRAPNIFSAAFLIYIGWTCADYDRQLSRASPNQSRTNSNKLGMGFSVGREQTEEIFAHKLNNRDSDFAGATASASWQKKSP